MLLFFHVKRKVGLGKSPLAGGSEKGSRARLAKPEE
jgi:hypothetical protein